MEQPLVSIVCEVYNHEPYIRKCLDGFVMQKTNFPFEILIHDDASTDHSASVIREYEAKYPELFRPIYQTENQYSRGVNIWTQIQFPRAKGKYIAICEGDDYWTDPMKLQKQVDYMETHPDCTLCFHNAMVHYENAAIPDSPFTELENRDYSDYELCDNWISPTGSFLFRQEIREGYSFLMKKHPNFIVGDVPLVLFGAQSGLIHSLPKCMSVYRKHPGSFTDFSNAAKTYARAKCWEEYPKAFGKHLTPATQSKYIGLYLLTIKRALSEKVFTLAGKAFYRSIIRHPFAGTLALYRILFIEKTSSD